MPERSTRLSNTGLSGPVVFGVSGLLLAGAPLIRGGNRMVALVALEWLALVLLLALAWLSVARAPGATPPRSLSWATWFLALSPVWVAVVQLVPLPPGVWFDLPGRDIYAQVLPAVQVPVDVWRPLSLIPDVTWVSLLAGLPVVAVFVLAQMADRTLLHRLVRLVVLSAFAQALWGLLQVSAFRGLYFDAAAGGRAIGSFANPNHFASYIGMTLPLTLYLLRKALRDGQSHSRRHRGGGRSPSARRQLVPAFWGGVLFVELAALLASLSRGGLAVAALAGLAATLLLPMKTLKRRDWWWRAGGAVVLAALVLATVGAQGLLGRMGQAVGAADGRWQIFQASWQAALAFWPAGAGLGTYEGVFPRFQPPDLAGFINFAHNDYLQFLLECGLLFPVLAGVAFWQMAASTGRVFHQLRATPADASLVLQASCGLGLLAVLLHSWVDFSLRIPANAMLAAFLFGIFLQTRHPRPSVPS